MLGLCLARELNNAVNEGIGEVQRAEGPGADLEHSDVPCVQSVDVRF